MIKIGDKFGRLTVVGFVKRGINHSVRYDCECVCDCGNRTTVAKRSLRSRHTQSCGCFNRIRLSETHTTHCLSDTPVYVSWQGMNQRCYNPKHPSYASYGGRGITVCERWQTFENFLADMGERPPGHSIDRIKVDGNYEPGNCRWATQKQQVNNTRRTRETHLVRRRKYLKAANATKDANLSVRLQTLAQNCLLMSRDQTDEIVRAQFVENCRDFDKFVREGENYLCSL